MKKLLFKFKNYFKPLFPWKKEALTTINYFNPPIIDELKLIDFSDLIKNGSQAFNKPSFSNLDSLYKPDKHVCPDVITSPNQCAVRLSRALIDSGIPMDADFKGKLCKHGYARGAQDLGAFLKIKWGIYQFGFNKPGSVPPQIKNKFGVLLFANIPNYDGQGHIDLWNGTKTKTGEYWNADPIWFWELPESDILT